MAVENFAGLVEGSLLGVGLDSRAMALLRTWLAARDTRKLPPPVRVGPYLRYRFDDSQFRLLITTRGPYEPSEAHPYPLDVISQLYARQENVERMEMLSRAMDAEQLKLRDATGLQGLGR